MVAFASRQLTDRCQFVSRSGPPAGAAKSHSPGLLPALHRSTMGTTTGTSGTVRARLFFNVSTYNSPPPLLARTARDNRSPGPGTITRSPHLQAGQLTPPKALQREHVDQLRIRAPARFGKRYEDWNLDEPAGQDINDVRPIRDEIRHRIERVISDLQPIRST
jgi:hypothetical protein